MDKAIGVVADDFRHVFSKDTDEATATTPLFYYLNNKKATS